MSAFYTTTARFYDADTAEKTDDLFMYSQYAETFGGPILDIGCGTGRVMLHLAQEDLEVHGIDNNRDMLDRLEQKLDAYPHLREKITYYDGDVMSYELDKKFNLVLLTYNALMHFYRQEDQIALLKNLRKWTAEDGRLIIDLPNAGEVFASQDTDAMILERTFLDPETGHMVMLQSTTSLDRVTQILYVNWFYDIMDDEGNIKRIFAPNRMRYYFFPEMQLLLKQAGYEVEAVFGDTDESPFEDGCERMIIVARPE